MSKADIDSILRIRETVIKALERNQSLFRSDEKFLWASTLLSFNYRKQICHEINIILKKYNYNLRNAVMEMLDYDGNDFIEFIYNNIPHNYNLSLYQVSYSECLRLSKKFE